MRKITDLHNCLAQLASGPVIEVSRFEHLLIESWYELVGNGSGGMRAYKLLDRTENMSWKPPVLEFQIERHGAAARGSVHAGVQVWRVDVQEAVADLDDIENRRLVKERDKPLKVEPIVSDIESLVLKGEKDPRLKWLSPLCVRVEISRVIPATNAQRTAARRKRFKKALEDTLEVASWHKVPGKLNTFAQS